MICALPRFGTHSLAPLERQWSRRGRHCEPRSHTTPRVGRRALAYRSLVRWFEKHRAQTVPYMYWCTLPASYRRYVPFLNL